MTELPAQSPPLLVVVGPTASGKTELAIRLAEALDGEVINADSVQIYRHFDIGSGKPTAEELSRAPHHLISALDPLEPIDAASWATLAEECVTDILSRGKRPIVCGGSFLWVRALLFGLAAAPKADPELRAQHQALAEAEGREALHRQLSAVDPECAARLNPNDFVRVSRALEVYQITGVPMSQWQAEHGFREPKRPYRLVGVQRERAEMDARISARAAQMLEQGFIEEVLGLCERGYGEARAMSSVGYREVKRAVDLAREAADGAPVTDGASIAAREAADGAPVTDGASIAAREAAGVAKVTDGASIAARIDRAQLLDAIAQKTRVFARRQRTWLRDEDVTWVAPDARFGPSVSTWF